MSTAWAGECKDEFVRMGAKFYRLEGYEEPAKHPDVYRGGFKMGLTVSVVGSSNRLRIVVESIHLDVRKFSPGRRTEYMETANLDLTYGAGPAKPRVFLVTLAGPVVNQAYWARDDSAVIAKSRNFLDTDDVAFRTLPVEPGGNAQIEGTILTTKTGVYDVVFRIGYRTGVGAGECHTRSIRIYQDYDG